MNSLENTDEKVAPEVKTLPEVVDIRRDHEVGFLVLSVLAFLISLPLPVVVPSGMFGPLGIGVLVGLAAVYLPWWANPLLAAAWVCGYRRWSVGLTLCSIAALTLGLSVLLIDEINGLTTPPLNVLNIGYYAWIISQAFAVMAGLVAPTIHAWQKLRAFSER